MDGLALNETTRWSPKNSNSSTAANWCSEGTTPSQAEETTAATDDFDGAWTRTDNFDVTAVDGDPRNGRFNNRTVDVSTRSEHQPTGSRWQHGTILSGARRDIFGGADEDDRGEVKSSESEQVLPKTMDQRSKRIESNVLEDGRKQRWRTATATFR
ncbi:unnamed protein product [Anisakis simplex]|uniref:Uncharacterized protein n=1 Tax=Anisakis simplex TaxID=6269 RepID=A0A3P6PPL5_ANISI|nr:unnamed protein product [Anisakis simplex]